MKTIKEIEKIIQSHKQELNEKYGLITIIGAFIEGMGYEDLETDKKTQYAVIRCLEVIGEAAKKSLIYQERSILVFHDKKLAE